MGEPTGKVVSVLAAGPLGPFAGAYRERLTRRGYAPVTTAKHVIHLGHLSRWLEVHGMGPADLTRGGWGSSWRPGRLWWVIGAARCRVCCPCWRFWKSAAKGWSVPGIALPPTFTLAGA